MAIAYSTLMSVLNWNNLANFVGAPDGGTMYLVLSEDWDITDADFKTAFTADLVDQTPIQLPPTGKYFAMSALFIQLGSDGQYINGGMYSVEIADTGAVIISADEAFPAGEVKAGDTLLIIPTSLGIAPAEDPGSPA